MCQGNFNHCGNDFINRFSKAEKIVYKVAFFKKDEREKKFFLDYGTLSIFERKKNPNERSKLYVHTFVRVLFQTKMKNNKNSSIPSQDYQRL